MVKQPLGAGIEILVTREYRFSTDAILLADFALRHAGCFEGRALDLGSGCGIIPFLWERDSRMRKQQKEKPRFCHVAGLEIQQNACDLAQQSLRLNRVMNGTEFICGDLRDVAQGNKNKMDERLKPLGSWDVVVCNPPYKAPGAGKTSPNDALRTARQEGSCTLQDILQAASALLRYGGRFFLCQRPERICDVMCHMRGAGIEPKLLQPVQQMHGKNANLFLAGGIKGGKCGLTLLPAFMIETPDKEYSPEMMRVYGPYKDTISSERGKSL